MDILKKKNVRIVSVAILIVLVLLGILFATGVFGRNKKSDANLSQEFLTARYNAAMVSKHIVELTTVAGSKIEEARNAEHAKDLSRAENLLNDAQSANNQASQSAGDLARNLEVFIGSLKTLPSVASQQLAYTAAATELSLVSEFVVYTKNVNDFIEKVAGAIETGKKDQAAIDAALEKANDSVKKINKLDADFQDEMESFDNSL